ncbi:hypothetical protein BHE74_00038110 [Ensete ventricosum]|nr:hypothetical protein BHE74_00038110 [Ensete ventricosum]
MNSRPLPSKFSITFSELLANSQQALDTFGGLMENLQSGRMSLESPEARTSKTSLGVPSLIDAKALMDLEVMRACHDFDSTVIEGSLVAIRKCYNIPEEYALHTLLPE